jgi:hypothetical protein
MKVQPAPCNTLLWWDVLWTWSRPKIAWEELLSFQRVIAPSQYLTDTRVNVFQVNHFPNAREISRKDHLKRNLYRLRNIPGKIGDAFDMFPATFTLPHEWVVMMMMVVVVMVVVMMMVMMMKMMIMIMIMMMMIVTLLPRYVQFTSEFSRVCDAVGKDK